MKKSNADYIEFLKAECNLDFVMIDPPWNYGMTGSKLQDNCENATNYNYWGKDNEAELVKTLDLMDGVKAVAVWATLPMLNATILAANKSKYFKFRSMITWIKRHPSGKPAGVIAHYFQNTTEYLVILFSKKPSLGIPRTGLNTHEDALRGARTVKPKDLESKLMNKWPGKWAYIFSGLNVGKLTINDNVDLTVVDTALTVDSENT